MSIGLSSTSPSSPSILQHFRFRLLSLLLVAGLFFGKTVNAQYSFSAGDLVNLASPTSLAFGPDGRLYVSQQNGTIKVYTIQRNGVAQYQVVATETILLVKEFIQNYNDDGVINNTKTRQVTGVMLRGTATNPILYVTSSDWRTGGGPNSTDTNLDTNSGVLSRLTWVGNGLSDPLGYWDKIDLVRGFPRSEENHSINGMDLDDANNILYIAIGGNTNKGAPSNNFNYCQEFAYSAAIVSVDLTAINALPTQGTGNYKYKYDLPTIDDPTRANVNGITDPNNPAYNGIDVNDPFGGNNGLNQARLVVGGPVQIHSPGYRNAYDVVFTSNNRLYSYDNGPNTGWGGIPVGEGPTGVCTNGANEGSSTSSWDRLHYITGAGYYAGHPHPSRANPANSGLDYYQKVGSVWNFVQSYPWSGFAHPPVPVSMANPVECDYINPVVGVNVLHMINASTNGLCEYTASNFSGGMQGDLLTVAFNGKVYDLELNPAGTAVTNSATDQVIASGIGTNPLDVWAQGDDGIFPGTIWVAMHGGGGKIVVLEPNDFGAVSCTGANNNLDEDGDGFTNADEIANGTNPCSSASKPSDFDGDFISDLIDTDDDNDGQLDTYDAFAQDALNGTQTNIPLVYPFSINNDEVIPNTMFNLGFTGLMTNGTQAVPGSDYLTLFDPEEINPGGATGKLGIEHIPSGDATGATNTQQYAFQFGLNVSTLTAPFSVHGKVESPFFLVNGNTPPPVNGMSQGIFIGDGTQDNYVKIAINAQNGNGGAEVVREVNGVVTHTDYPIGVTGNILASVVVDLYLSVNTNTLTVQPQISVDGGVTLTNLGSPLAIPAGWLNPLDSKGMATGIIATNGISNTPFAATWDMMEVLSEAPFVQTPIPNIARVKGSAPESINLHTYFEDNGGDAGLTYQVVTNTGVYVTAAVAGNLLNLTFPANNTETANITVRATDANGYSVTDQFSVAVTEPMTPLYRVNAGGAAIAATDAPNPGWAADNASNPSTYRVNGGSITSGTINNRHSSVPAYVPQSLFNHERWDPGALGDPVANEMQWNFPAPIDGTYMVNLFFGNSFAGTSTPNTRLFDVVIEGTAVLTNYDIIADVGHLIGLMKTFQVEVTDGELNIVFLHKVQNPNLRGIEIQGPPAALDGYCVATPNPLHFFSTEVNTPSPAQQVTITNTGAQPLTVSDVTISGVNANDFSENFTGPVVIPAGASSIFSVVYTPLAVGSSSANLNVIHDGFNNSPETIILSGEAIPANGLPGSSFVNAGGPQFPAGADVFVADDHFSLPSSTGSTNDPIANTTFDGLFQTFRTGGDFNYQLPLNNGTYQIELYFSEPTATAAGQRKFNVDIEGRTFMEDFDIFAEADARNGAPANNGQDYALVKVFYALVEDGVLDVTLYTGPDGAGQPIISAIGARPSAVVPGPAAFIEVNPGEGLNASTHNTQAFRIRNVGNTEIISVSIDLRTALLPDLVFDPTGNAGDGNGVCFTANSGAAATGLITNGAGTGPGSCVNPFSVAHNGGYDVITINFSDFNGLEELTFQVDVDPNSIQGNSGAGSPADVSGFELTGATVTVSFGNGAVYSSRLFDAVGKGASNVAVAENTIPAPSLSMASVPVIPATLNNSAQTIVVTGTPGAFVKLIQVDSRLYIANGQPPFGVADPTYYANEVVNGRTVYTAQIGVGGTVNIPVTLLQTLGGGGSTNGGINSFVAVVTTDPFDAFAITSNLSNLITVLYQAGSFPVEYLSFDAKAMSQSEVLVTWKTATELNNSHFDVEKSDDGRIFMTVGTVGGAGTTSEPQSYQFVDRTDMYVHNYYRLKQVDLDGGFTYSDVVEVNMRYDGITTMLLFPNPAKDQLQIRVGQVELTGAYELNLYDATGRLVMTKVQNGSDLATNASIEVGNLVPGIYLLECRNEAGRIASGRFMKE